MKVSGAVLVAILVVASSAFADIIPTLNYPGDVTVNSPGVWQFDYTMALGSGQRADAADGNVASITIYDFFGFNGVHSESVGWAFSSANTGLTPPNVILSDASNVPNLTWTWTGAELSGPMNLGVFSSRATYGGSIQISDYAGQATQNGGPTDGLPPQNRGLTAVPAAAIPEPAAMFLIGSGLIGLAMLQKRLRKH